LAGWRLKYHYILYPNPWPKPQHLLRRWHAHPVFPLLQNLGGHLEMRCNWKPYALEFSTALKLTGAESVSLADHDADRISSPFERKYRNSGLPLFRVKADFNCLS
jgi:tRNA (guanine-N7-)-methyltransferase